MPRLSLSMPASPAKTESESEERFPTSRSAPVSRTPSSIQVLAQPTKRVMPSRDQSNGAVRTRDQSGGAVRTRPPVVTQPLRPVLAVHSARTLTHLTKGSQPALLAKNLPSRAGPITSSASSSGSSSARSSTSSTSTRSTLLLRGTRSLPEQTAADHLLGRLSVDLAALKSNPAELEAVRQRLTPRQPLTLVLRSRVDTMKGQLQTKDARIAELEAMLGSKSTTASSLGQSSAVSGLGSPTGVSEATSEAPLEVSPTHLAELPSETPVVVTAEAHAEHRSSHKEVRAREREASPAEQEVEVEKPHRASPRWARGATIQGRPRQTEHSMAHVLPPSASVLPACLPVPSIEPQSGATRAAQLGAKLDALLASGVQLSSSTTPSDESLIAPELLSASGHVSDVDQSEDLDEDCHRLLSVASRVLDFDVAVAPPPPLTSPPLTSPPLTSPPLPPPPLARTAVLSPTPQAAPAKPLPPLEVPSLALPATPSPESQCRTPVEERLFDASSYLIEEFAAERARREADIAEAAAVRAHVADRRATAEAAAERLAAPKWGGLCPQSAAIDRSRGPEKVRPEAIQEFVGLPEKRERYKTPATRAAEAKAAAEAAAGQVPVEEAERCVRLRHRAVAVFANEDEDEEDDAPNCHFRRPATSDSLFRRRIFPAKARELPTVGLESPIAYHHQSPHRKCGSVPSPRGARAM